ncbi:MAG TPA: NAD-dependent epimerase/dehydratase family protein [bacterium]|nr:NAD-dependent epimerase/dehydratase family protein [bacterium]
MTEFDKITIIIPSYESKENDLLVKKLLESMGKVEYPIIIQKNKSGLTIPLNDAVQKADPTHDLIFLSDDMILEEEGWIEKLREKAYSDPKIGAVTSSFTWKKVGRVRTDESALDYAFCGFNLCYIKREVIDKIFPLDEEFLFFFWEDDVSIQMQELGYKVVPESIKFTHPSGRTVSRFGHFQNQVFNNSWKHFTEKYNVKYNKDNEKGVVLVTGSKGFIGQHLVEELKPYYEVIEFDLPEHDLLTSDFDLLKKVDYVVNLAAQTGLKECHEDPIKTIDVNVTGLSKLLFHCAKYNIKKVVHVSTWAAENEDTTYDVSKACGEKIVNLYRTAYGLETVIVRLGTTYGKGMKPEGVIAAFLKCKEEGTTPVVTGDGTAWRQFTYVNDTVKGIKQVLKRGWPGKVYYVLSSEKTTINELLESLELKAEYKPSVVYDVEPFYVEPTSSRELRWKPEYTVKKGMEDMIT